MKCDLFVRLVMMSGCDIIFFQINVTIEGSNWLSILKFTNGAG